MFYRLLESRKVLIYLALPDLKITTKLRFETVLSKYGSFEYAEKDLIKFYSRHQFLSDHSKTDRNIKKYVRNILTELGHSDF